MYFKQGNDFCRFDITFIVFGGEEIHSVFVYLLLPVASRTTGWEPWCGGDSNGNHELCSSAGGQEAGTEKEGLLQDEEETHSHLKRNKEVQMEPF